VCYKLSLILLKKDYLKRLQIQKEYLSLPPLTTVSSTQFENKAMTMHNFSKLKQNVKSKQK
jgi:hypothetical protein